MRKISIIALLLAFALRVIGGDEIKGKVLDKSTNQALPYATIALASGQYGVISDASGAFRLVLDDPGAKDTVVISYVGYKTLRLTARDIIKNGNCLLEPYVFTIDEVVITPHKAEDILRQAYDNFYKNHVHKDMATYGYYREQIFEGNSCVRYGEAVFATRFFQKNGKDMAALEPYLGRSIDDSTFLKKLNGIFNEKRMVIPVGMDAYIDNDMLSGFKIDQYYKWVGDFFFGRGKDGFSVSYALRDNYVQDGRESYFITFNVNKKKVHIATGQILIDKETYGIAAFEVKFREQENLTKMILPPKIRFILKLLGYGVNLADYEARLTNRFVDSRWYIGQGMQILRGGIAKRGDWINGSIINEFHAYYSKGYQKPEKKTEFKDVRMEEFQPAFWKDYSYSPIQPLQQQYIEQIIRRNDMFTGEVLSKKVQKKLAQKEAKD